MHFLSLRLLQRLGLETSSPWQELSYPSFPMFSTSSLASTGCLLTKMHMMEDFTNIFIQIYLRNDLNRSPTHQNDLRDIFNQAHLRSAGENWEGGSGGRGIRALTRCSNLNSFQIWYLADIWLPRTASYSISLCQAHLPTSPWYLQIFHIQYSGTSTNHRLPLTSNNSQRSSWRIEDLCW